MDHPDKKVVVRITKDNLADSAAFISLVTLIMVSIILGSQDSQALTAVAIILLIAILLITMSWTYWRLK